MCLQKYLLTNNFLQKHQQQKTFHVSITHKKMNSKTKLSYFFSKKKGIFSFSKKKVIQYRYFFSTPRKKKYDIFTHSPILGEFLQKQSSTWGKKIRPFWPWCFFFEGAMAPLSVPPSKSAPSMTPQNFQQWFTLKRKSSAPKYCPPQNDHLKKGLPPQKNTMLLVSRVHVLNNIPRFACTQKVLAASLSANNNTSCKRSICCCSCFFLFRSF